MDAIELISSVAEPGVVVFEKRPRWGPELERQFQHERVRVRQCRLIGDILPRLPRFAPGVIVLNLDDAAAECLQFLGRAAGVPVVAVGSRRTAELEWPLREAGVTAFLLDGMDGEELAEACRRFFRIEDQASRMVPASGTLQTHGSIHERGHSDP